MCQEKRAWPSRVDAVEKVFLGWWTKFFRAAGACNALEVRDHVSPQESTHRASYMSYRGLQQQGQLKTNFCKIFRTAQFSTFSTASVNSGSAHRFAGHPRTRPVYLGKRTRSGLADCGPRRANARNRCAIARCAGPLRRPHQLNPLRTHPGTLHWTRSLTWIEKCNAT